MSVSPSGPSTQTAWPSRNAWSASQVSQETSQQDPSAIVRLHLPKDAKRIRKSKCVMSFFVTNQRLFDRLSAVYKSGTMKLATLVIWLLCDMQLLSVAFAADLLPPYAYIATQSVCTVNLFLHYSMFLRVDIISQLAYSFNFWFALWNTVSFNICFVILWGFTPNVLCAAMHSMSSMLLMVFYDAHSRKEQLIMRAISVLGVMTFVPVLVVLLFNLVDFHNETFYYEKEGIEIINVRLHATDTLLTSIMYFLRIFYIQMILGKSSSIAFLSNFYEIDEKQTKYRKKNQNETGASPNDHVPASRSTEMNGFDEDAVPQGLSRDNEDVCPIQGGSSVDVQGQRPEVGININQNDSEYSTDYLIMGILEQKTIEYDLRRTLYHQFLVTRMPLFAMLLRSKTYSLISISLGLLPAPFTLVLAVGIDLGDTFQHIGLAVVLTACINMTFQTTFMSNFIMLHHMAHSFDYWYVMFLISKIFFSSGVLCDWDNRMVYWVYTLLVLNSYIMADTLHIKSRKISYISIVAIVWGLAVVILCKLNIGDTFSQEKYVYMGSIQVMSARITLSSSLFSACLFLIRFLWSYYRNPRRILFITENVRVENIGPNRPGFK